MTILPWHESAVGIKTPLQAAKYTVKQTIELQTKFGGQPIEVDPEVTKWLKE
jgi:hypothetical protein